MYHERFLVVGKDVYNEKQLRAMLTVWKINDIDKIMEFLKTNRKIVVGKNIRILKISEPPPKMPIGYKDDMTINEEEADLLIKWFNAIRDLHDNSISQKDSALYKRILEYTVHPENKI